MQTFYDRFKELSDQNLLQRINGKERFQKEAVLAAYHILTQRGYNLEHPYPDVEISQEVLSGSNQIPRSFLEREYHVWFKKTSKKRTLSLLILFFLVFSPLVWYSNSSLPYTNVYRHIHLFSQTIIGHGSISYVLEIVLIVVLFLNTRDRWISFLKIRTGHIVVALKVFFISLAIISIWEVLFSSKVTIANIADGKTARELLKNFWFGGLIAFTEELIFKWLLLSQLMLRFGDSSANRRTVFFMVSALFAAYHIPIQITDYGGIKTFHLIMTFVYSYCTSVLYVKHRNFPLVVLLHFLMNISIVFLENGGTFYFNWLTILLCIYCIPSIKNGWLFRSKTRFHLPRWAFTATILLITGIVLASPKQPKDFYNYSRQYYYMDSYDQAMNLIEVALYKDPDDPEFLNHRGNIFYDLEQYDSAWLDYNKAVQLDSNFHGAIRNRGLAAKQVAKYQEGVEDLTIVIINELESSRVYQNRGSCYLGIDEPELAISDFEQALKRDVNNELAYYGLGRAYLKLKEFEKSSENLELAILIDPNFVQAYEVLAMAYSGLNKRDSSNAIMTRAIEMGSTNPLRFYVRGLNYYSKEDYFNAVKEFEKSIEFLPDEPDLFLNLAYSYLFLENYNKGCQHLNRSAELGSKQAIDDLDVYCN